MQMLAALARHGHFGRAAEECGISQPAFSARIQKMEQQLGAPLIKRGHRFLGFTVEGEIALRWARRILADAETMRTDMQAARGGLTGHLRIGAVPTAVTFAAQALTRLHRTHPGVRLELRSASSKDIRQGLLDGSMEAGLTYLSSRLSPDITAEPLYDERYVLIGSPALLGPERTAITWAEAAELPLCLLSSDMRNRKIIDRVFEQLDLSPDIALETNAFTAALVQASAGLSATVAPEELAAAFPLSSQLISLPLSDPEVEEPIAFAYLTQSPPAATVQAVLEALKVDN